MEGLVRLWAHEALRLFQDRLVEEEERVWTNTNIDDVALKHFPNIDKEKVSLLYFISKGCFPFPPPLGPWFCQKRIQWGGGAFFLYGFSVTGPFGCLRTINLSIY